MMTYSIILLICALVVLVAVYVVVSRKTDRPLEDHFVDGLEAMLRGDWKQAAHHLRLAAEQDSDNIKAYDRLGRVYRELGELSRAMKIHRELTVRSGLKPAEKARIYVELSRDLKLMGREDDALEAASRALATDRRNVEALVNRLELLEARDRWEEALDLLKRIENLSQREQKRRRSLIMVEQARGLVSEGKGRQGRILVKDALKLNRACAPAYLLMGDSYMEEERVDEAVSFWEQLPFEDPPHAWLVFERLERVYFENGRFGEMEKFYQRVIASAPESADAYLSLARFYEKKGEFHQALRTLEEGLAANPAELNLSRMMVRLLAKAGDTRRLSTFTTELADRLLERSSSFKCRLCSLETPEYSFRCPSCHTWESMERVSAC